MLASLILETVDATRCSACGRIHRFKLVMAHDEAAVMPAMHGFFAFCPVSGRRSWYVIDLAQCEMVSGRLVRIGPADDEQWEPEIDEKPLWAQRRSGIERSEAVALGPLPVSLPRGMQHGGFRARSQTTDMLRRALGCPHTP